MLATRKSKGSGGEDLDRSHHALLAVDQQQQECEGLPDSIFHGLTFPEAPTTAVDPRKCKTFVTPSSITRQRPTTALNNSIEYELAERKDPSTKNDTVDSSTKKDNVVMGKFDSLYQPQVITAAKYPEIPQMTHGTSSIPSMEVTPTSSSIVRDSDVSSSAPVGAVEESHGPIELVNQLLEENTRLRDEIDRMRRSAQLSETERTTLHAANTTTAPQRTASSAITANGMTTGLGIDSMSNAPAVWGQKYVCCGMCRQWLQAPLEATYVYCPRCNACNDCTQAQASTRQAAVQQRIEPVPYRGGLSGMLLNCWEGITSGTL